MHRVLVLHRDDVLGETDDHGPGRPEFAANIASATISEARSGWSRTITRLAPVSNHALRVELLERLLLAVLEGDEPHEQHHRRRVLPCGVQAHVGVGRSGTTGHHRHTGNGVHLAVGLRHVGGTALVAADDVLDGGFVQTVQDIEVRLSPGTE